MSLIYTEDQNSLREVVRDFAEKQVAPRAAKMDSDNRMDPELVQEMRNLGFMGLGVPTEYGGEGLGSIEKSILVEELARKDASTAELMSVHSMAYLAIQKHGSDELKEKYLTRVVNGEIAAFALTETSAGSDASAIKTTATEDGDYYVLNGSKCFISNMGPDEGDFVTVLAITDKEKGVKGTTAFVVDRNTPGFSLGKREDKLGIRAADVSELIFEDCRVHKSQIVGEIGSGFRYFMECLDAGRIGMASQALGLAEEALDLAVEYANERIQFGKPVSANQGLQWYFADMATKVEAMRALIYEAATSYDRGENVSKIAAIAKYYASENAFEVVNKALQIFSGYGYMKDYPLERMLRDARIIPIYEGTSEVQKMIIAREILQKK